MNIACIVLAAGRSERFGGCKLSARLGGRSVLEWTLSALVPGVPAVCVCASDEIERIARLSGVAVARYAGGALSDSLRTGLDALPGADGYLFINGDQPLLKRASLQRLMTAFETQPDCACRLAFGGVEASPVLLPGSLAPALRALRGERGGMAVVREKGIRVLPVEAGGEEEIRDVDTPELLERSEAFLNNNMKDGE